MQPVGNVIIYWQSVLDNMRYLLDPSVAELIESTIKLLNKLKELEDEKPMP